jgi:hypothetical protein
LSPTAKTYIGTSIVLAIHATCSGEYLLALSKPSVNTITARLFFVRSATRAREAIAPLRVRFRSRHTRLYGAFVTTAPVELDSPATVTLHAATFSEIAGFAADLITLDELHGQMPTRLILVDALELAWQRAKCRGNQHVLLPADPVLVGLNTLQHWLWQRLQAPTTSQVTA